MYHGMYVYIRGVRSSSSSSVVCCVRCTCLLSSFFRVHILPGTVTTDSVNTVPGILVYFSFSHFSSSFFLNF